jgi:DNA-binding protein HU-beta
MYALIILFEKNYKTKNMNKVALAEVINEILNTTKTQAEQVVDAVFNTIQNELKKGGEVSIAGFGKFSVKDKPARMARNPKTGEQVKVAASKAPKFGAAKALKEALN